MTGNKGVTYTCSLSEFKTSLYSDLLWTTLLFLSCLYWTGLIQWGSEILTSLDFEWSKRGWVAANGLDFEWDLKSRQMSAILSKTI